MIGSQGAMAGQWAGANKCLKSRVTGCPEAECSGAFGAQAYVWTSPAAAGDIVIGLSCWATRNDVTTTVTSVKAARSAPLNAVRRQAPTAPTEAPPVDVPQTDAPTSYPSDDYYNPFAPTNDVITFAPQPAYTMYPTGPTFAGMAPTPHPPIISPHSII